MVHWAPQVLFSLRDVRGRGRRRRRKGRKGKRGREEELAKVTHRSSGSSQRSTTTRQMTKQTNSHTKTLENFVAFCSPCPTTSGAWHSLGLEKGVAEFPEDILFFIFSSVWELLKDWFLFHFTQIPAGHCSGKLRLADTGGGQRMNGDIL